MFWKMIGVNKMPKKLEKKKRKGGDSTKSKHKKGR